MSIQSLVEHVLASARDDMDRWKESGWITRPSHYEKPLCDTIGFEHEDERYKDADFVDKNGRLFEIEIKKGQDAMWFDKVRYAEMWQEWDTYKDHVTMFVEYNMEPACVKTISFIELNQLMKRFKMNDDRASKTIEEFHEYKTDEVGQNDQLRLSKRQMKDIATANINVATLTVQYNHHDPVESNPVDNETDYETAQSGDDESEEESVEEAPEEAPEEEPEEAPVEMAPVEKPKKDRRKAEDIYRILAQDQRVKHSVYDRRSRTTSTQVVRYDKRSRSFVDEVSGIAYKTLNHMGETHLFKIFGTPRKLSVWVRCQALTPKGTWEYLGALYDKQRDMRLHLE